MEHIHPRQEAKVRHKMLVFIFWFSPALLIGFLAMGSNWSGRVIDQIRDLRRRPR